MKCVTCGYDDNGTGDSAHMCSTKPFRPRGCKHGQLARSCEICGLEAENAQLKAELAARWLPIESAPKEGAWALVYADGAMGVAYIMQGKDPKIMNILPSAVTHWMPLPAAPVANLPQPG